MTEDTTRKGVSASEAADDGERIEPDMMIDATNPRRANVANIVANHRRQRLEQQFDEELAEAVDGGAIQPEPAAAAPAPAKKEPAAKPAVGEAAPEAMVKVLTAEGNQIEVPLASVTVVTKVDGDAQETNAGELVKGYQTASAGQRRIREGTERLRAAEAKENELTAREAALAKVAETVVTEPEKKPKEAADTDGDARFVKAVETIQFGEPAEAGAVLRELVEEGRASGSSATPPDEDAIADRAAAMLDRKQRYHQDLIHFGTVYRDIADDPHLRELAANEVHTLRAERLTELGHDVTGMNLQQRIGLYMAEQTRDTVPGDRELFMDAGQRVVDWAKARGMAINVYASTETASPETPAGRAADLASATKVETRTERKQRAGRPPRAATAVQPAAPKEPEPRSRSQVVAGMAASRRGFAPPAS